MIQPAEPDGHSGLRGLAACIHKMSEHPEDLLSRTRAEARTEGANVIAARCLLNSSGIAPRLPILKSVQHSTLYRAIGFRWGRILNEFEALAPIEARAQLEEIYQLERIALRSLETAIA